jgi:release factor glutamine methyltransferase
MSKADKDWTVLSMLKWATDYFTQNKVSEPRLSIEWMLSEVLGVKRLDLYLQFDRPLSTAELKELRPMVKRRAAHEPLQYIIGNTSFVGTTIYVEPGVLIPRIETEQLVDHILEQNKHRKDEPLRLLDLGTGSGCIPIAIKKEYPAWICSGVDISPEAIAIARKNAQANETEVEFWMDDFSDQNRSVKLESSEWDLIVSNPPYITDSEKSEMDRQVLDYEPHMALFHENPLNLYKDIIRFAAQKKAITYLECNDKSAHLAEGIATRFYGTVQCKKDLDGNNRFLFASNPLT